MGKRFWSLALSMALVGGVFSVLPARAQEAPAPAVPSAPNIVDPVGDANLLNSGTAGPLGQDNVTPADASSIADLLAVWFSHTADSVSVHWQTEAAPPGGNGVGYQAFASPGEGEAGSNTTGCLRFLLNIPGSNPGGGSYQDKEWVRLLDRCNVGTSIFADAVDGTYSIHEGPDGTGIVTATFPRSYSPLLADGLSLSTPTAAGNSPIAGSHTNGGFVSPSTDNTKPGTDYVLSGSASGGPGNPSEPSDPPGKNDPPGKGKKKGCGKGKGKQKGACPGKKPGKPKPPVGSCPAYVPGEEGAEAETAIVTDAATEEKPVELDFDAPPGEGNDLGVGMYDGTASLYQNIQVDTQSADTGLYVRYEFPDRHDYDLYLNYPDGSTAANSGDFNVAPGEGLGGGSPEGGWEAGSNYEQVMGIRTADCAGYTARLVSYLTTGGATKLKIWLGPVVADPVAPGGGEMASDIFFNTLGMRNPMTTDSAKAGGTPAATKGCTKGKGKKKGCKKPPVASCAPITPAEQGADKPTIVVTDAATAEAPIEQTVTLAASMSEGIVDEASYDYFNVQVDSAAASAGLYATFEFPTRRDYDLYARWSDGSEAASSHGFNPAAEASAPQPVPFDPSNTRTNHAGETHADSENLVGLITPDCGGYTLETVNWLGEGGELTVKLWLGEGTTEPLAPGERPA